MLLPPLSISIDHRDLGLFLGSLFCSIGLYICTYASTRLVGYSGLVIQFDIRYCDPSYFALLSQNCLWPFMVPYKFLKCLFYICEICHWYFNKFCASGSMDILMMLILPIHEHGTCFHLFVSSLISFFSVV